MSDAKSSTPVGALFSSVYVERGDPAPDGERFRIRLAAYIGNDLRDEHAALSHYLLKEFGYAPSSLGISFRPLYDFREFTSALPREQFLDFITHVWRFLLQRDQIINKTKHSILSNRSRLADQWHTFVGRVLLEEKIAYTLDEKCGIRVKVDYEFDLQRDAALVCLSRQRFGAARTAYQDAHRYFSSNPPDLKAALKTMFEAVEIVVKQMYRTDRLTAKIVSSDIKEKVLESFPNDPIAKEAASKIVLGFADWVDGMHFYRHGQGTEEPVVPPRHFVIYALSSGAAFIRLLIHVEGEGEAQPKKKKGKYDEDTVSRLDSD